MCPMFPARPESGVALRFPPHSKTVGDLPGGVRVSARVLDVSRYSSEPALLKSCRAFKSETIADVF